MYSQLEQELIKLAKAMELIKMADETKGDETVQQGHTISSLTKHVRGATLPTLPARHPYLRHRPHRTHPRAARTRTTLRHR